MSVGGSETSGAGSVTSSPATQQAPSPAVPVPSPDVAGGPDGRKGARFSVCKMKHCFVFFSTSFMFEQKGDEG